ncbi:suppressor of glycerol defect, partial [Kickxella alabastrina]
MPPKRSRHQGNTEMPASLAKKLDRNAAAAESKGTTDDGRFTKKFKINAKTRKDVRKQARNDKKQRKNESHRRARGFAATPTPKSNPKQTKVKPVADSNTAKKQKPEVAKKPAGNTEEEERARLTRFAKRNEGMYQLLRDSNLIANVDEEAGVRSKADGTDDMEDREMRRLERNLGIKSNQKLAGAFFEEGLGDLFEGIEFGSKSVRTTKTEAAKVAAKTAVPAAKRAVADKQARQVSPLVSEDEGSFVDDDDIEMASSSDSEEEDNDESDDNDEDESEGESEDDENVKFGVAEDDDDDDMFGLNDFGSDANDDGSDSEDSDIAEMYRSQGVDINPDLSAGSDIGTDADSDSDIGSDEDDIGSGEDLGSESDEDSASEAPAPSAKAVDVSAAVSKYIPPSLRRKEAEAEDERIAAIRKALQGQLNRLSESNIEGIITQVEALYQKYPRHHVTDVLGDLILQAIRSRTHMLDSFLYVNAALVGAVYRAVGLEPIAHMVQKLMEEFEKYFSQGQADFIASKEKDTSGEDEGGEFSTGKECQNLSVFIAELYNFQVISCQLVYDVIRMCITDINEFTAELLLKVIRISGVQLRRDDPLALKEIVHQVTDTVGKAGTGAFSVRCQFMVESLTHLKDNRMRNTMSQNAENVVRLK